VVTLVVPGLNDSEAELREMAGFLAGVSRDIPWHVTAFHSDYQMPDTPDTPTRTLLCAYDIGREAGLRYVYPGNRPGQVGDREHTRCPKCEALLIERRGFRVLANHLKDGCCPKCVHPIPGVWS
jgi:pyruvate formate lyase activating enzyme